MKTRNLIWSLKASFLYLFAASLLASSPVQAATNKNSADAAKAKKEAIKEKADKLETAVNRAVEAHLMYLKTYLPRLTAADIRGRNIVDLRRFYYEAYRVQGMSMDEATRKAATEITLEKAGEITTKSGDGKTAKNGGREAKAHFDFLSSYFPSLTASDVGSRNTEDLRQLYYEAYRKQGMTMVEAEKKAGQLDLGPAEKKKSAKPAPSKTPETPAVVDTNFDYLKPHLPWLRPEDMRGKSDADLKSLYYQAYRAQGMTVQEATQTAERLVVVKLSSDDDPYSLAPGQIASSTKTIGVKKPNSSQNTKK
jgi:hypothetical protein